MFQLENIQFKRGDKATNDAFVGKPGSISIDRESKNIRIHDGVTPGGLFKVNEVTLASGGGGISEAEVSALIQQILDDSGIFDEPAPTAPEKITNFAAHWPSGVYVCSGSADGSLNAPWTGNMPGAVMVTKPNEEMTAFTVISITGEVYYAVYMGALSDWTMAFHSGNLDLSSLQFETASFNEFATLVGNGAITPAVLQNALTPVELEKGFSASVSIPWSNFIVGTIDTTRGAITLANPTNVVVGTTRRIIVGTTRTGTGTSLAFGTYYKNLPSINPVSGQPLILDLYATSETTIVCSWVRAV